MRFLKAPEALKHKWLKPLKAHYPGKRCMPTEIDPSDDHKKKMSEDCLFMNVYVPGIHIIVSKSISFLLSAFSIEFIFLKKKSQWCDQENSFGICPRWWSSWWRVNEFMFGARFFNLSR